MPTPNPFPLEIVNKVNSPELLAFLQQFGHDKYADATDINKILQALQFIYENLGGAAISDLTKFTVRPTIDISGTAVLVSDDGEWIINGVPYAQTEGASFSFSLNDEGNERFVLIIAGTDGNYNTVEGEQSATNPGAPTLPLNCLLVSIIFITDSTITEIPLSAIQNNYVRVLEIPSSSLSGEGTEEEQICEYILALPTIDRTILETDSKWNIIIIDTPTPGVFAAEFGIEFE